MQKVHGHIPLCPPSLPRCRSRLSSVVAEARAARNAAPTPTAQSRPTSAPWRPAPPTSAGPAPSASRTCSPPARLWAIARCWSATAPAASLRSPTPPICRPRTRPARPRCARAPPPPWFRRPPRPPVPTTGASSVMVRANASHRVARTVCGMAPRPTSTVVVCAPHAHRAKPASQTSTAQAASAQAMSASSDDGLADPPTRATMRVINPAGSSEPLTRTFASAPTGTDCTVDHEPPAHVCGATASSLIAAPACKGGVDAGCRVIDPRGPERPRPLSAAPPATPLLQ